MVSSTIINPLLTPLGGVGVYLFQTRLRGRGCLLEREGLFNPLSPNSDQHQFSPNNIHTRSREKIMRTNKMITKEKMPCSTLKFSQLIFKGNVWRSGWRIYMWTLGLKGLI